MSRIDFKLKKIELLYLGIISGPLLLCSVLILGFLEPGYSHYTMSVSTLGSLSAKYTFQMNLIGLFIPGLMVFIGFISSVKLFDLWLRCVAYLMSLFGIMFAGLAVPMDSPSLFGSQFTLHYILAYLSVIPFFIASVIVALKRREITDSKEIKIFFSSTPVLFTAVHFSGILGVAGGMVQRGLLLIIFLWIFVLCFELIKLKKTQFVD